MGSMLGSVAGVAPPRIGVPFEQVLDDTPVEALPALITALLADPATLAAWVHASAEPEPGDPALQPAWRLEQARADADARVALTAALARITCWAAARHAELLTDGAARYDTYLRQAGLPHSPDAAEYGALRIPAPAMAGRLIAARDLTSRFPATLAALAAGAISPLHATALQDLCAPLPDQVAAAVEARVLPRAPRQTVTLFRASVRRAIARDDPDGTTRRHRHAVQTRRGVTYRRLDDGMAAVTATLPAAEALSVMGFLDATARVLARAAAGQIPATTTRPGEDADWFTGPEAKERGIRWAQRRADALVLAATALAADPTLIPSLQLTEPVRPVIHIQVPAQTLAGLAEDPGELDGYGPIPAELARLLAADGAWARDVTGAEGQLLDTNPLRYQPSPRLRAFVTARDQTCRAPACTRPARACDLDHARPFNHDAPACGGPTTCANVVPPKSWRVPYAASRLRVVFS